MLARHAQGAARLARRCLALALLSCLASCVADCGLFCSQYDLGEPLTLVASVKDKHGNLVPVDSATLQQGTDTFGCTIDGSGPRVGCNQAVEGDGTLTVQAMGQTITREVDIGVVSQSSCKYTQEVALKLPGPGCAKPHGNAIEGRVLDAQGKEMPNVAASVELYGRQQACRVAAGRFQCPSMSPYNATYTLELSFGVSRMERDVFVLASECRVDPVDATLDLAAQCGASNFREPAVAAIVTSADPATTEVRIVADGSSAPCARVSTEPNPELKYDCPALTTTGGGKYRVTVDVGGTAQTKIFDVTDDGCNPDTAVGFFYF